ncbi:MAG TPA: hypothetical protein VHZ96_08845 [Frankiaceae bacterium]|jgi:hypothetical protein|nr:hypothetical protein [Frankiaceae bacterium]
MDISEFYDANPARRESDEEGFGDGWSTEADQHSTYRASWLHDTGELYVVREPHPGGLFARYLDQLDIDQVDIEQLTVEVLGRFDSDDAVKQALSGWEHAMTRADSLDWLRTRVSG